MRLPYSFSYTEDEPTELLNMFRTSGVQEDEIQASQEFTGLKLTGMRLGYLLNFGEAMMKTGITRTVNGLPE